MQQTWKEQANYVIHLIDMSFWGAELQTTYYAIWFGGLVIKYCIISPPQAS